MRVLARRSRPNPVLTILSRPKQTFQRRVHLKKRRLPSKKTQVTESKAQVTESKKTQVIESMLFRKGSNRSCVFLPRCSRYPATLGTNPGESRWRITLEHPAGSRVAFLALPHRDSHLGEKSPLAPILRGLFATPISPLVHRELPDIVPPWYEPA